MLTRTLPFDDFAVREAAALILAGGCVAVATETVYGLAADATSGPAVAGIYRAKGRPGFNPLIVHVGGAEEAEALALFDSRARDLAARFWPGPLTLVLPARRGPIAPAVTAGLPTIAIRVPAHPAMRALLAATNKPLAAPSANRSGAISPTIAAHVGASLGGRIPLIIDSGASPGGLESTIVAPGPDGPRLLRPGPVTVEMLGSTIGSGGDKIEAPGQLTRHYRPSKPLVLDRTGARAGEWLIGFGAIMGDATLSASGDLGEAAAALYARLHEADASPRPRIAVAPIPADGIGAAINDRLKRAASC